MPYSRDTVLEPMVTVVRDTYGNRGILVPPREDQPTHEYPYCILWPSPINEEWARREDFLTEDEFFEKIGLGDGRR